MHARAWMKSRRGYGCGLNDSESVAHILPMYWARSRKARELMVRRESE